MAVVDRPLAEAAPRMREACGVASDDRHDRRGHVDTRSRLAQRHGTEYHAPSTRITARGLTVYRLRGGGQRAPGSAAPQVLFTVSR